MQIRDGVVEAIGHTPLIKLERASAATGCTILGKAEFMNPGGSVKDRPGRQMILEAEKRGELKPGGLVVEGTAGNTGIGLALVASARGYRTIIVIPNTQSQEKKDMLRLCGAELIEVPALPYSNPDNYQHVARRLAEKLRKTEKNGVLFADQWNNRDNRLAHTLSTGPEIWDDTQGKVDGFICSIGTGGTVAGTSIFLREKKKDIVIGVADPRGAAMYNLFSRAKPSPPRAARSPRASVLAASRRSSTTSRSTRPISFPTRRPYRSFLICWNTRGCASAARRASTSRAPSASRRNWAQARPS
jgi:cysteine synthase A